MTKHPKPTWILVARRSGASIFSSLGSDHPIDLVREIDHPEGRLKAGEIDSDRPGRSFDRGGQGRHALSVEESPTERIDERFASELAADLERARHAGEFNDLVIVAAPKLLGRLRSALSENTRKVVIAELGKDFVDLKPWQVREHL
ncbi:MAG TPA: host attachment protein, partial [Polyangiales bacterium]|nr:host attachment protein [Polyangiales bacterium]